MKKLWVNILIFFGCFLLLVTSLGAVLIIAPGMELLGIMYIRSTSGSVDKTRAYTEAMQYETINISTDNIPLIIEFVQSYTLTTNLVEKYNGYAKAGEEPNIEVSALDKTLYIKSNEYKPFLFHSRDEKSGLFVKVPMYYEGNIIINSNSSDVVIAGQNANLNDIAVKSNGEIEFKNSINMHSLSLTFGNKTATISDNVNLKGVINATAKGGNLIVPNGFTGTLNFTSTTGSLICGECGQLTFKSNIGQLKGKDGKLPVVNGDAKIETGGKVEIARINGSGSINIKNGKLILGKEGQDYNNRLNITSKWGKITLNGSYTNAESTIKTKYGNIVLDSVNNMKISTTRGDVEIKNADGLEIETKSGDVNVQNAISNLKITTTSGDVVINNAIGDEYSITTKSGDVKFHQGEGKEGKLTITSNSGKVELFNIVGETMVTTKGKIFAEITEIKNPISLNGKNKAVKVTLKQDGYLDLSSKKNIKAPNLTTESKTYNTVPNSGVSNILTVKTNRGKIEVKIA